MASHESIGAQLPSNPGSYNDFLTRTGMQPGTEALERLGEELATFRQDLVAVRGLDSLEELHAAPLDFVRPERAVQVGSTALAG